jgi:hypothetical protein
MRVDGRWLQTWLEKKLGSSGHLFSFSDTYILLQPG